MKLTQLQVKNAKPGRYADGDGLYLLVSPKGTKSWVLRVQVNGRRRDFGLGAVSRTNTLADARENAAKWRKLAKEGKDPSVESKRDRGQQTTLETAARQFYEERKGSWKNPKHKQQWINTLETYAFPKLGGMSVDRITAADIQQVLTPIWQEKPETARRVRQRIGTVLDYCQAKGWRETDAPMRAVNTLLRGIKQSKARNFPAMPYKDVPAFIQKLEEGKETVGRLALQFLIYTAARSGEVRGATWQEIDLVNKVWKVPAERMKMERAHIVPLSDAALAILEKAQPYSTGKPSELVFRGLRRKPLSDMTLTKVLRSNGGEGFTVHGFRSSFRDWAAENGYNNDWAEAALAHAVSNRVEAAYRRTEFLDQRVGLMSDWADFCQNRS